MRGRVTAVVGAQYGSEGKGAVIQHLAQEYKIHVRTGGPNAGHTIYYNGEEFKMQVIPCGWINQQAELVIGVGALVDVHQLEKELTWIKKFDPYVGKRIYIDENAGYLDPAFKDAEGGVDGEIHNRIGSTGKGVGAARVGRISRDPEEFLLMKHAKDHGLLSPEVSRLLHHDTAKLLHHAVSQGDWVLLEGAQGSGLSLLHGPWPYVTSTDTNAAQMLADCGLPPNALTDCILVARTYPIRVAGNSGPLEDEITWNEISRRVGRKVEERTTVTNKIRRIGKWDSKLFIKAVRLNGPTEIALTFLDYLYPKDTGKVTMDNLSRESQEFIDFVETLSAPARVRYIGTGPGEDGPVCIIDRGHVS